jgi:hypothetical protein
MFKVQENTHQPWKMRQTVADIDLHSYRRENLKSRNQEIDVYIAMITISHILTICIILAVLLHTLRQGNEQYTVNTCSL